MADGGCTTTDVRWLMVDGGWRISRVACSVVAGHHARVAMPGWVDDIVQPVVHQILARQDANDMVELVGDDQVLCSAGVEPLSLSVLVRQAEAAACGRVRRLEGGGGY